MTDLKERLTPHCRTECGGYRGRLQPRSQERGGGSIHRLTAAVTLRWLPRRDYFFAAYDFMKRGWLGQRAASSQFGQSGRTALQRRRPWKMSQWEKRVQSFCGTSFIRAGSIFFGSVWRVRPSRAERRATWVSTTTPTFFPKALPRTTLAVLRPTPGSSVRASMVSGTFP